jgi:hypothetical protein
MGVLLLVTWLHAGQPPSSYQVEFDRMEACERARAAILADARRLAPNYGAHIERAGQGVMVTNRGTPPQVSAVCVSR